MKVIILIFCVAFTVKADDGNCNVVPITQWGKSASKRTETLPQPVNIVVVQHTATSDCNTDDECETQLNNIRNLHVNQLNFDDIGNSFLIGGNGKVYEGAGWEHIGAHTKGYNHRAIGISFIGNFMSKLPTEGAIKALQELLSCGVANNHLSQDYHLVAHSQLSSTLSPGEMLKRHIQLSPHWLENAKELLG